MVQVPVLPLRTPLTEWTHGVYIDEFTEYQTRDMPARQAMGAFIPSQGVGTGFRRDALDALALSDGNRIFEPVCLTEDYRERFALASSWREAILRPASVRRDGDARVLSAHRDRCHPSAHAMGHRDRSTNVGSSRWTGGLVQKYWLWRDRKGLLGNPVSLLTNSLVRLRRHSMVLRRRDSQHPIVEVRSNTERLSIAVSHGLCWSCISVSDSP